MRVSVVFPNYLLRQNSCGFAPSLRRAAKACLEPGSRHNHSKRVAATLATATNRWRTPRILGPARPARCSTRRTRASAAPAAMPSQALKSRPATSHQWRRPSGRSPTRARGQSASTRSSPSAAPSRSRTCRMATACRTHSRSALTTYSSAASRATSSTSHSRRRCAACCTRTWSAAGTGVAW